LKVVCTLPVAFCDLEFPPPYIVIVIVRGTFYEGELLVRLKGCLPRGTLGDFCRSVSRLPHAVVAAPRSLGPGGWCFRREVDVEPKSLHSFKK